MRMGYLRASYLHDLSSGGDAEWLEKHGRYARVEARTHAALTRERAGLGNLLHRDPLLRRRTLKRLSYILPARPALRFFYQYVLRGGFLDGAAGLHYCRLLARYERFCAEEMRLLRPART